MRAVCCPRALPACCPCTYLLFGGHASEHLHVGDEAQQLLGVLGLQVGQAIACEAQRMLQGQCFRGALDQGQHDAAVDGAPLAGLTCRASAYGQGWGSAARADPLTQTPHA